MRAANLPGIIELLAFDAGQNSATTQLRCRSAHPHTPNQNKQQHRCSMTSGSRQAMQDTPASARNTSFGQAQVYRVTLVHYAAAAVATAAAVKQHELLAVQNTVVLLQGSCSSLRGSFSPA